MKTSFVIGIAGGSGSGKTTVASLIAREIGEDRVATLTQDSYYRDLAHLPLEERTGQNFDHPDAIEAELMAAHVRDLRQGRTIDVPTYDFAAHTRRPERAAMAPRPVLIVEGILVLVHEPLRELMDVRLYVDTDDDIRFIRRLRRDIRERGRDVESVVAQYLRTVRPMHLDFVERSKRYADFILPWREFNANAVEMVIRMVRGYQAPD